MDGLDLTLLARRVSDALAAGHSPAELRSELWVHVRHGVVVPAYFASDDALTSRVSEVIALLGTLCSLGGWASLNLQGNTWFDGTDNRGNPRDVLVHCLPGAQLRARPGLVPSQGLVHPDELLEIGHHRLTTMARAAYDEMRIAPTLTDAVIAYDMSVSTTSLVPRASAAAVARVLASHHKTRGIRQATAAVALGSTRSASPAETRTRLVVVQENGLKHIGVNVPLFGPHGDLLGVADLLDEESGLVVETDGEDHAGRGRRTKDNRRYQQFEDHGATVVRVTTEEHQDSSGLAARVRAARRRATRRTTRAWTTAKPDWWWSWAPGRRWD